MAIRKWGIDLTKRKMKWIPYGINEEGKKITDISGITVVETISFFVKEYNKTYPNSNNNPVNHLLDLLNNNVVSKDYKFTEKMLFNSDNYYRNETWFYINNFIKKIINNYSFCLKYKDNKLLSDDHKIYEKGFIEFFPFFKKNDGKIIGPNTKIITNLIELIGSKKIAKKINFDFKIELFEWINYSLPDDSVKFNYSILKNDFSYVDSEIGGYFFEFIKILSGDDDILKKVAEMNVSDSVKILALGLSIKKMFQLYSYFSGIHDNTANYKFIKFEENIAIIQRRPVEEFCNSVGIYFRANIRNCCDLAISTSRAYTKKLFLIEIKEVEETKCAKNKNDFCEYKFTWNKKKLIKLSFFINLFISLTTSCFIFILLKFLISSIFLQRFTSIVIFVLTFYNISIWKYIKKLKQIIEAQREKNQKDYNLLQNINLELIKEKNTLEQKVADRTQQLQQSKTEIETINQQRKNYFIDFAHEMKTPLTLIWNLLISVTKKHLNFAVKIGDSKELNAIKSDLAIIKNNVGKLKTDTINYLDIEKLEKGEMIYDHSSIIDINDVLQNKIPLFKETAKIKNIGIKLVSKENFFIKCDGTAIDRIINNMLVNAIKYTNNGGSIDVLLKNVNDKIELIVKDTGIGISDEQKEFIFKPFYQIPYQKQQIQGMGIGLSLVRKIVNEVKGEIKVESRLSKGSTFTILFHKYTLLKNDVVQKGINYSTPIINISTKQLFPEEHKEGRKNILAVEDNIDLLAFLQENLYEQYNFYYAINGKEALEKLKEMPEKPHLILLDLMMDVMSGDDFLIKMRKEEEYKNVSVIILTARTEKSESLKQLGQGAIDYIQKPFDIDILAVKIDAIIKSQEVQKITVMLENKEAVKKIYEEYKITKRQLEIIRLLNEGLEYRQVALKLNISENSVKTLIKRIYKKCKVINKIELFKVLKMVF